MAQRANSNGDRQSMTIRIERDIVFGEALVDRTGIQRRVPLRMDAYLPAGSESEHAAPAPAVVLAFGGAFHRGTKEDDAFSDGVGRSTAISDYARRLAARGFAAFSVAYRLAQTDPVPPADRAIPHPELVPLSRIDVVRQQFGLPPISARRGRAGRIRSKASAQCSRP